MQTKVWDKDRFKEHGASAVFIHKGSEISGLVDHVLADGTIVVEVRDDNLPDEHQGRHHIQADDIVSLTYGDE